MWFQQIVAGVKMVLGWTGRDTFVQWFSNCGMGTTSSTSGGTNKTLLFWKILFHLEPILLMFFAYWVGSSPIVVIFQTRFRLGLL